MLAERSPSPSYLRAPVGASALPPPPRPRPVAVAAAQPPRPRGGFHLISPAVADTMPDRGGASAGDWAIQVGAFANAAQARAATSAALHRARGPLASAHQTVGTVRHASATLYRARLTGLSRARAHDACRVIVSAHGACIVLSPEAQS
jgi:hypothetical protein